MVLLSDLVSDLNRFLDIEAVRDYCPNGLQVSGREKVMRCVVGVTACQELLEKAASCNADAILVHHGYFWKGDSAVITGPLYQRLRCLIHHEMSLIAYHLPLDLHPELGNNKCFGDLMGFEKTLTFTLAGVADLGWMGKCSDPMSGQELSDKIEKVLGRVPFHVSIDSEIHTVAWCTGAAQDGIIEAARQGADAFITGEVSERTVHMARELGLHFFAAGHHATERYGIKALGEYVSKQYNIDVEFIDIDNPV